MFLQPRQEKQSGTTVPALFSSLAQLQSIKADVFKIVRDLLLDQASILSFNIIGLPAGVVRCSRTRIWSSSTIVGRKFCLTIRLIPRARKVIIPSHLSMLLMRDHAWKTHKVAAKPARLHLGGFLICSSELRPANALWPHVEAEHARLCRSPWVEREAECLGWVQNVRHDSLFAGAKHA